MNFKDDNENSIYKLAQMYQAVCEHHGSTKLLQAIVEKEGDVNYTVPNSDYLIVKKPEIIGNTAMHFAVSEFRVRLFASLMSSGGNFMIKNKNGMNALHLSVQSNGKHYRVPWYFNNPLVNPIIDMILVEQISRGNSENPRDDNGISHLHAACMTNNAKAVEHFLSNGASVDQPINTNSPLFPGYTPLHIASKCNNVETVEILLKYAADIRLTDSKRMTPLHLLMEENMVFIDTQKSHNPWEEKCRPISCYENNEKIMLLILASNNLDAIRDIGLTPLHVACATRNTAKIESLLQNNETNVDQVLNKNSPFGSGYTALHVASIFHLETVKLLLKYGSDPSIKDTKGLTAFEMCLKRQALKSNDIHFILSHHVIWKDTLLSDNATKLIDLVSAMESPNSFASFLHESVKSVNIQIAPDSHLWPGYTPLHLAMTFYKRINIDHRVSGKNEEYNLQMVESCLKLGADVTIQDIHGRTPLHHAFELGRTDLIKLLCEHHVKLANPMDKNGLSHLHIACAEKKASLAEKLMSNGDVDVNHSIRTTMEWPERGKLTSYHMIPIMYHLPAGSTPLHIAVAAGSWEIIEMLLKHGGDVHAKDANGMTPMHWILTSIKPEDVKKLLSLTGDNLLECVGEGGLGLLHVASATNEVNVVKQLLDSGVDVDTKITYKRSDSRSKDALSFLSIYADFTPLHFAMAFSCVDAIKLLVKHGADIIAKFKDRYNGNIVTPLYDAMSSRYCKYDAYRDDFISTLKSNEQLQRRVEEECGVTMLHLACWQADFEAIERLVKSGRVNVNAQIHFDSPMWQGYTPIYLLLKKASDDIKYSNELHGEIYESIRFLLDYGADINLQNAKGDSIIHYAYKRFRNFCRGFNIADSVYRRRLDMLLYRIKDFRVNPVNNQGMSYFHIACLLNNTSVIKKFLRYTADVKQPIDHFSKRLAGYSPLHLSLFGPSKQVNGVSNQIDIVNILANHGADVNAQDSLGNTPFHCVAESGSPRKELFQTLLRHRADIFSKNIWGKTPLEALLEMKNGTTEEIKFFLENGYSANMFNPISEIGYLTWALCQNKNYVSNNDDGRSIKRTSFEVFLNESSLTSIDELGRTAIHNIVSEDVASFDDSNFADIVEKLKSIGCFIDHQDILGRTPLHAAARFRNWHAVAGLLLAGSNVNIIDASGRTAFDYLLESSEIDENERERDDGKVISMRAFSLHIHKLLLRDFDIHHRNRQALERALATNYFIFEVGKINQNFYEHVEEIKVIHIGQSSLVLYDFLSETGAISNYPYMTQIQKNDIKVFFEVDKRYTLHHELHEVAGLLKLQYGKANARSALVRDANESLLALVRFPMAELCAVNVLRYLSNGQLQSLIESTIQGVE